MKKLAMALALSMVITNAFAYSSGNTFGQNRFNDHQYNDTKSNNSHIESSYSGRTTQNTNANGLFRQVNRLDDTQLAELNVKRARVNVDRLIKNLKWLEQNPTVSQQQKDKLKEFQPSLESLSKAL